MAVINLLTDEVLVPEAEQESFPILVIHGYEIYEKGGLGPLSHAVCRHALRLFDINRDLRGILLGGWHLKEAGPHITIADAMQGALIRSGIPKERIITKRSFRSLDDDMPPRDTWEELVMLVGILRRRGIRLEAPITSVAWDFHIPRLKKMYATYGLSNVEFVPVTPAPYEGLGKRKWMERMARIVRCIDPHGIGIMCHKTRLDRTLNENLRPIIP